MKKLYIIQLPNLKKNIKYGGTYIFEIKFWLISAQESVPVSIIDSGEIKYGINLCLSQIYIIKSNE
jgi:hypothetical protein